MTGFYPYPERTLHLPVPSLAVLAEFNPLSGLIYPRMHQTGDGRFRPNKIDYHLRRRYYRGGWHRPYPPLIPNPLKRDEKHRILLLALGVPDHGFPHCQGFATAASRRTWILVSESISGLLLSQPVRVEGWGTLHPLQPDTPQAHPMPPGLSSTHRSRRSGLWGIVLSFPRLSPSIGQVTHVLLSSMPSSESSRLACLNRTPIAVASGRINRISRERNHDPCWSFELSFDY